MNGSAWAQDVLSQVMTNAGGTPMTVAEATLIADNALEHTVRCLLAAMAAPEVLKSTQGEENVPSTPLLLLGGSHIMLANESSRQCLLLQI